MSQSFSFLSASTFDLFPVLCSVVWKLDGSHHCLTDILRVIEKYESIKEIK